MGTSFGAKALVVLVFESLSLPDAGSGGGGGDSVTPSAGVNILQTRKLKLN